MNQDTNKSSNRDLESDESWNGSPNLTKKVSYRLKKMNSLSKKGGVVDFKNQIK